MDWRTTRRLLLPLLGLVSMPALGQSTPASYPITGQGPKGAVTFRATPWSINPGARLAPFGLRDAVVRWLHTVHTNEAGDVVVHVQGEGSNRYFPTLLARMKGAAAEALVGVGDFPVPPEARAANVGIHFDLGDTGEVVFQGNYARAENPTQTTEGLYYWDGRKAQKLLWDRQPATEVFDKAPAGFDLLSRGPAAYGAHMGEGGQVFVIATLAPAAPRSPRGGARSGGAAVPGKPVLLRFENGKCVEMIDSWPTAGAGVSQPREFLRDVWAPTVAFSIGGGSENAYGAWVGGKWAILKSPDGKTFPRPEQVLPGHRALFSIEGKWYLTGPAFEKPVLVSGPGDVAAMRDGRLLICEGGKLTIRAADAAAGGEADIVVPLPAPRWAGDFKPGAFDVLAGPEGWMVVIAQEYERRRVGYLRAPGGEVYILPLSQLVLGPPGSPRVQLSVRSVLRDGGLLCNADLHQGQQAHRPYVVVEMDKAPARGR